MRPQAENPKLKQNAQTQAGNEVPVLSVLYKTKLDAVPQQAIVCFIGGRWGGGGAVISEPSASHGSAEDT